MREWIKMRSKSSTSGNILGNDQGKNFLTILLTTTWIWHHEIFTFSLHPDQQNDQKVLGNAMSLQILTL
jgi:hypothetical protein